MYYSMSDERESLNLSIDAGVKLAMKVYATGARQDVSAIAEELFRVFLAEKGINVGNIQEAVAKVAEEPPEPPTAKEKKSKRIGFKDRQPKTLYVAPNRWGDAAQEHVMA